MQNHANLDDSQVEYEENIRRLRQKKHNIKCFWILPLKWGLAVMALMDILIAIGLVVASVIAYIMENKSNEDLSKDKKVQRSVIYFLFITDGVVVLLFSLKVFYGMLYFSDIICPPKKRKGKDRRPLTDDEKKILIVKTQKKSLSNYFTASAVTYMFAFIQSLMQTFIFFFYWVENESYLGYFFKNLALLIFSIICLAYALKKIIQQIRM